MRRHIEATPDYGPMAGVPFICEVEARAEFVGGHHYWQQDYNVYPVVLSFEAPGLVNYTDVYDENCTEAYRWYVQEVATTLEVAIGSTSDWSMMRAKVRRGGCV